MRIPRHPMLFFWLLGVEACRTPAPAEPAPSGHAEPTNKIQDAARGGCSCHACVEAGCCLGLKQPPQIPPHECSESDSGYGYDFAPRMCGDTTTCADLCGEKTWTPPEGRSCDESRPNVCCT